MAKKKGTRKKPNLKQPIAKPPNPLITTCGADVSAATATTIAVNPPVLWKVCRLCETKDGPFLNIFDADKVIAKKIEELLPFGIAENDELPHKICFRCSAKVEELHEFIQKCIKTQENLCSFLGKKGPVMSKARHLWEEQLNKSNISNDDICDAVIKKAMENIKIPIQLPFVDENAEMKTEVKSNQRKPAVENVDLSLKPGKENTDDNKKIEESSAVSKKVINLNLTKCDQKSPPARASRSKPSEAIVEVLEDQNIHTKKITTPNDSGNKSKGNKTSPVNVADTINNFSMNEEVVQTNLSVEQKEKPKTEEKVFNIMDHVSIIKVNGVGILFQCKMCNRNFLKQDVVASHGCAKNNKNVSKNVSAPEPPKPPTVKYLNINLDEEKKKKTVIESKTVVTIDDSQEVNRQESNDTVLKKTKPRIGPASKVKRDDGIYPAIGMKVSPKEPSPPPKQNPIVPSVQFPSIPSLNSRYKLVPGPNNTFTLVEELNDQNEESAVPAKGEALKKRKSPSAEEKVVKPKIRKRTKSVNIGNTNVNEISSDIIDLIQSSPPRESVQPYPVGLFKTVPHHSSIYTPEVDTQKVATPAMKKQSYTIVPTGHPSKLLISSKPQPPVEEVPKKRLRKSKVIPHVDPEENQPFSVTLEDAAPPKDAGFFTFINVDPLLQPSYVLPTDNIIQESQITTSTPLGRTVQESNDKEKYTCNMCSEKFTREKKLLAHIQSHYSKMDEEDQLRSEKTTRKRGKKSLKTN